MIRQRSAGKWFVYSTLMFASRATRVHFSTSPRSAARNQRGTVPGLRAFGFEPLRASGWLEISLISLLSLATIGVGTPAGASIPHQMLIS